jgi:hypothetical protein
MHADALKPSFIDEDTAAFMQRGVSIIASSRGADVAEQRHPQPSLMRALGCRVSPDRRQVTILLNAPQSCALLDDIRATGQIAVVFSQPSTHRAVQIKARLAQVVETTPHDWALASQYQQAYAREVEVLGYPMGFAMALMAWRPADLAAVSFIPEQGYEQTPGLHAGAPLSAVA